MFTYNLIETITINMPVAIAIGLCLSFTAPIKLPTWPPIKTATNRGQ